MKKKILLLSFATLLCSAQYSFAKVADPIKVKCFEADGATIYDVRGCVPGSDVSFYSNQGGGWVLKQVAVGRNGMASVTWSQKASPAFVLNVLDKNTSGISGNGTVSFIGDKEFVVNDVALDNNGGTITLRWNASVSKPQSYTFEILKSLNGIDYSVIQTVNAQSNMMLPYSFTDVSQATGKATYQVRVVNTGKEVYYTSNPLYADGSSGISVYPTVTHTTINIVQHNTQNSGYRIVNMKGQVMASGVLGDVQNSFSVANLPSGNYLIEISGSGKNAVAKFVKE